MTDNVAGMLAYVTIIPAIVFLVAGSLQPKSIYPLSRLAVHFSLHRMDRVVDCAQHFRAHSVSGWLSILLWPLIGLGGLILDCVAAEGKPGKNVQVAHDR